MQSEDAVWWATAFALVVVGTLLAYALWRLGRMLRRVDVLLHEATDEVVPVIGKVGTSLDTVNMQLQKVDLMMDSAVDVTDSVDVSVRAVSAAVTTPVKKVAGFGAGVAAGLRAFRERAAESVAHDTPAPGYGDPADRPAEATTSKESTP